MLAFFGSFLLVMLAILLIKLMLRCLWLEPPFNRFEFKVIY